MALIALLGGTRFIGPAVASHLLERGHEVVLVHRGVHRNAVSGARVVLADRADGEALHAAVPVSDVVIDMRAMNTVQAETATSAIRDRTDRVVVLSSQDVYAQFGALLGHPCPKTEEIITEESPLTIPFPYANTQGAHDDDEAYDKKDVERVYRASGFGAVTILRVPATYGSGDPRRRFGASLDALDSAEDQLPRIGGQWRWTHAHVRDVAHAIALAAEQGEPGTFNIGEAETPTISTRVETIARHAGISFGWREVGPDALDDAFEHFGAMANDVVVSSALIRARLGFTEVTTLEERMKDLISALRASRGT